MKLETKPSLKHKAFFINLNVGNTQVYISVTILNCLLITHTIYFGMPEYNMYMSIQICGPFMRQPMEPTILKLFSLYNLCNINFKKPTQCTS